MCLTNGSNYTCVKCFVLCSNDFTCQSIYIKCIFINHSKVGIYLQRTVFDTKANTLNDNNFLNSNTSMNLFVYRNIVW